MNADSPTPDLAECVRFAAFWCEATGLPHVTLTAITPDGPTTTATFQRGESAKFRDWITREQASGRNVYFQPNETPAGCASKAAKQHMVAAVCRHADVDPDDDHFPLAEERQRLARLAECLAADPDMPPTAIIDSGNGMQPLWAVAREPLAVEVVERIEAENRAVEAALGAFGTHDVSRLLRLPGTVNFPNAKKRSRGRAISRARLIHALPRSYRADEAARLGEHLAERLGGSPYVRARAAKAEKRHAQGSADTADLLQRIEAAVALWPMLARRWGGDWSGLKGDSRSDKAMALGGALKRAGFTFAEMRAALALHRDVREWTREKGEPDDARELRHIWDKAGAAHATDAPDPELLANPDMSVLRLARREPPPFPLAVLGDAWERWTVATAEAAACPVDNVVAPLLATASALIGHARWAQATPGWAEPPHLWCGVVGDSGTGKSPGADALLRDVLPDIEGRMLGDFPDRLAQWRAAAEVHAAAFDTWKSEVRKAHKDGNPPPMPPADHAIAEPQAPRLRQTDVTIEKVATLLADAAPKGLLIVRDELSGWLLGMTAYNDAGRAFWVEAYGGRPYRVERQKHPLPIIVPRLAVAVTGGTQPEKLAELFREADDGLLARLTWFWPNPLPFHLGRVAPATGWAIAALDLLRLLDLTAPAEPNEPPRPIMVPLAEAVLPTIEAFGQDMQRRQEGAGGLMRSAYGKARGLALRLSLVLEFLWWCGRDGMESPPVAISERAFLAATHLVADYLLPMAERVYGDAATRPEDRNAATLARWIVGTRAAEVHVRKLQREVRLPGLGDAKAIRAAADVLAEAGWLTPPSVGFGTARKVAYTVNPRVLEAQP
jgi:hypothetical protein